MKFYISIFIFLSFLELSSFEYLGVHVMSNPMVESIIIDEYIITTNEGILIQAFKNDRLVSSFDQEVLEQNGISHTPDFPFMGEILFDKYKENVYLKSGKRIISINIIDYSTRVFEYDDLIGANYFVNNDVITILGNGKFSRFKLGNENEKLVLKEPSISKRNRIIPFSENDFFILSDSKLIHWLDNKIEIKQYENSTEFSHIFKNSEGHYTFISTDKETLKVYDSNFKKLFEENLALYTYENIAFYDDKIYLIDRNYRIKTFNTTNNEKKFTNITGNKIGGENSLLIEKSNSIYRVTDKSIENIIYGHSNSTINSIENISNQFLLLKSSNIGGGISTLIITGLDGKLYDKFDIHSVDLYHITDNIIYFVGNDKNIWRYSIYEKKLEPFHETNIEYVSSIFVDDKIYYSSLNKLYELNLNNGQTNVKVLDHNLKQIIYMDDVYIYAFVRNDQFENNFCRINVSNNEIEKIDINFTDFIIESRKYELIDSKLYIFNNDEISVIDLEEFETELPFYINNRSNEFDIDEGVLYTSADTLIMSYQNGAEILEVEIDKNLNITNKVLSKAIKSFTKIGDYYYIIDHNKILSRVKNPKLSLEHDQSDNIDLINLENIESVEIYDFSGRHIATFKEYNEIFKKLDKGLYLLIVRTKQENYIRKVSIEY
ncbi:MAG: T9SS type A sorting domain-containing protein [Chlorobiota bacterium]